MKLLLINERSGKVSRGETRAELLLNTGIVQFDMDGRRALIKGVPDTVSFSRDFTDEEMLKEMGKRVLEVLTRDYSFTLYTIKE